MIQLDLIIRDLSLIREKSPLVHNITNYVVMNNTANALLSIGASPVMAHSTDEVEEMASIASSLVLNIGTLSKEWIEGMIMAGKIAMKKGLPIVLDPVGAGATSFRTKTCFTLIEECHPTIIRGNASEIMTLARQSNSCKGVDSMASSFQAKDAALMLAKETNSIIVVSGETDYITDGNKMVSIKNGSSLMSKVTGMGCTATAITGAFAAIDNDPFQSAVSAMAVMGITGELAALNAKGPGTMQLNFLDELYLLSGEKIKDRLKTE